MHIVGFQSTIDPGGLFATGRARFSIWAVLMGHDPSCGRSFPSSRPQNGCVMSMQPAAWPEPHPQIAAAVKAMYGSRKTERPLAVEVRDRLGQWGGGGGGAGAGGGRGRAGWVPARLVGGCRVERAGGAAG